MYDPLGVYIYNNTKIHNSLTCKTKRNAKALRNPSGSESFHTLPRGGGNEPAGMQLTAATKYYDVNSNHWSERQSYGLGLVI